MLSQPSTVLYVEDNEGNRMLVRRVLEAEGYSVLEAGNATEGFELAQEKRPDLILIDINLPETDGLTLTSRLKATPSFMSTPIIAITANVMRGDRERSLAAGCDGYIQKPIDVDFLPLQIAQYLQPDSHTGS